MFLYFDKSASTSVLASFSSVHDLAVSEERIARHVNAPPSSRHDIISVAHTAHTESTGCQSLFCM